MGITINPPDLDDILDNLKNEIFANMNCVQIGKIKSYDVDTQSAEIEIQFNRRKNETETSSYPVLVDCPVFVLQGGGAYLNFPIKEDDFCLMLFNDRDIDDWWVDNNVTVPSSLRKHSLSDGIALVGLNPKNSALALDDEKVILNATGYNTEIVTDQTVLVKATDGEENGEEASVLLDASLGEVLLSATGDVKINHGEDKKIILNEGTDFAVRFNELETAFNQLKDDFDAHDHLIPSQSFVVSVSGQATGTLNPAPVSVNAIIVGSTADISNAKVEDINVPGVGE